MVETSRKPSSNRSAKERRNTLFRVLDGVLSMAHKKITLEGNIVTCPRHHAKFDVTTGKVASHPKMPLIHPKAND